MMFRTMRAEDRELFKSFIRSLPRKDNYCLLVDVHNDQAIDRWMETIQSGETIGMVTTKGSEMIGYCNLKTNDLLGYVMSEKFAWASQPLTGVAESARLSPGKFSRSPGRGGCKSSGRGWPSAKRRLKLCSKTWASVPGPS